ncbi:MAG: hypothetical protein MUF54_24535, partial [Polyangiaceae bacterium]|nr:hypothetical protein [Polyangiaceae bacterium]
MASPSKNLASPLRELPGAADDRPIWRKLLPFGIALALTVALLLRLDLQAFVAHLRQVNYPGFLAFCGGFVLLLLTADVFATSWVYSKTICPVSFRELFLIRGASYLPSVVNHHIGQAWLTWYLARVYRAPLWRVAGATLLVYATVFASLFALGTVSLLLGSDAAGWLAPLVAIGATAGVAYLIVIHLRPRFLASRLILAP